MTKPHVLVLMTTYNGERFLAEQIDSVLAQEGVLVDLRIADDCSSDATLRMLAEYAAAHACVHVEANAANKGVVRNFMDLVCSAPADVYDFFAICDQDDVWLPGKLAAAVASMDAPPDVPELYYADVVNVNADGSELGREYAPYERCANAYASLLLVQNWCLGCTALMNPALVKLLQEHPVTDFGRMYDAWIHAVALYCGGRVHCDLQHSYIRRRITGSNVAGVMNERHSPVFLAKKALRWLLHGDEETSAKHTRLARVLLREYGDAMDMPTRSLVEDVAARLEDPSARRRLAMRRDICMPTATRTLWLRTMVRIGRF